MPSRWVWFFVWLWVVRHLVLGWPNVGRSVDVTVHAEVDSFCHEVRVCPVWVVCNFCKVRHGVEQEWLSIWYERCGVGVVAYELLHRVGVLLWNWVAAVSVVGESGCCCC